MDRERLARVVKNSVHGDTYLRPFVIKNPSGHKTVFVVGINPASPVKTSEVGIDEYLDALFDFECFLKLYGRVRARGEKISKTRAGLNDFSSRIIQTDNVRVLETNVITFPTRRADEIKALPAAVIKESSKIFLSVLLDERPSCVLVHGKTAMKKLRALLSDNEDGLKLIEVEDGGKYITYSTGEISYLVCSRHFMYYGPNSEHFADVARELSKKL